MPTTSEYYRIQVTHVAASPIGKMRLGALAPRDVERFRDQLLASGRMSRTSVGKILKVLSSALRKAVAMGYLAQNPADPDVVTRPMDRRRPVAMITPEVAKRILAAAEGHERWDAVAHLSLLAGLRREEILGLRWQDVDQRGKKLRVRQVITRAAGISHIRGGAKSEAGLRTIPMGTRLVDALQRQRVRQADTRRRLGQAWNADQFGRSLHGRLSVDPFVSFHCMANLGQRQRVRRAL
jgi:integrase